MYRLKQYIVFGGLVWIVQLETVRNFLSDARLSWIIVGLICVLLLVAVGLTIWVRKTAVKSKDEKKDVYPLL